MSLTFLVSFIVSIVGSKAGHPSWIIFLFTIDIDLAEYELISAISGCLRVSAIGRKRSFKYQANCNLFTFSIWIFLMLAGQ